MAVSLSIGVSQNSQSIENNTSNVTVTVYASWTYGSHNQLQKSGSVTIDGTTYSFTSSFNYNGTSSGSQAIWSGTVNVAHNTDGTKTLSCSASYVTGVSSGTIYASASAALTTIPRKSTLTAENGTLGTAQTITINRNSSTFYHRLRYACGDASGSIGGDTITDTSVSWTPPLSLAAQNTSGTSVSITLTLYTYAADGTLLGTSTKTISCAIPESVKPTVSLSVSDAIGYLATYGGYLQGLSKIAVEITAAGVQGSTIKAYNTTADGKSYASASFTTDPITGTGTLTIITTVTDTRGRTATASTTITVLAYSAPKITALSVYRSNSSGTAASNGAYLTVKFSAAITSIDGKNTAAYTVQYKAASASSYTSATLSSYAGNYAVTNGTYTFAADTATTFDVILTATDAFGSAVRTGTGGTVSKLFSILNKGLGWAFGKVAEKQKTVEIADGWDLIVGGEIYDKFDIALRNGLAAYSGGGDNGIDPNTTLEELCLTSHTNAPQGLGTFYFIQTSFYNTKSDTAARAQIAYPYKIAGSMYHRYYSNGEWSSWVRYTNIDEIFPVNSVVIMYSDESPASIYGGTWHRMESRFLWACPSTSTIGLTAGEMTHTLTIDEMPSHYHYIDNTGLAWFNAQGSGSNQMWFNASGYAQSWSQYAGGSAAHNNMPPYVNVAIWRRTA